MAVDGAYLISCVWARSALASDQLRRGRLIISSIITPRSASLGRTSFQYGRMVPISCRLLIFFANDSLLLVQFQDLDTKIQDVYKRIQTERKVLEASQLLRQATTNQDVLRRNDAKIKEAERSLSYFEDTLRELQARKMQLSDPSRSGASPRSISSPVLQQFQLGSRDRAPQYGDPGGPQYSQERHDSYHDSEPSAKAFTKLDLIKADTPHSPLKISRMLHQLEFKLQVELQYKKGIEKMVKLYQADGDKKSRADAEGKRVESEKKIQLLQTALKRYKTLHVLDATDEEEEIGTCPPPLPHILSNTIYR